MEVFGIIFGAVVELLKQPMPIFGFSISYWDVIVLTLVVGTVISLVLYFLED